MDSLTPLYEDFASSSVMETSDQIHRLPGEHRYQGMTLPGVYHTDVLHRIPHVQYKADDVIVVTYPKAGTTWLSQISWLIMNDVDVEKSRSVPLHVRSPVLEMAPNNQPVIDKLSQFESPRVLKTHLPYAFFKDVNENPERSPKPKVVVGLRNVRDVLVSLYNFYRMNQHLGNFKGDFATFFRLFEQKRLLCGDYFDHVISWWENCKNNPDVHIIKYEDLKKDPRGQIKALSQFLGKNLDRKQLDLIVEETAFESMQKNPATNGEAIPIFKMEIAKFVRKGEVGDWQNYFTDAQVEIVNERCKNELESVGLHFDYF